MPSAKNVSIPDPQLAETFSQIEAGRFADPFFVLGPHEIKGKQTVTAFVPGAVTVAAISDGKEFQLEKQPGTKAIFTGEVHAAAHYCLKATNSADESWEFEDPYRFGPVMGELDEYLIGEGKHYQLWWVLGAHVMEHQGVNGTHFAVWAPNASRVSVVGDFNLWDGRRHVMRRRGATGVWELFIPGIGEGVAYKYEILAADGTLLPLKADPVGFGSQHPPSNASIVRDIRGYGWKDGEWMGGRAQFNDRSAPISIYEVHLASWQRMANGRAISYKEAAEKLVEYVLQMGFTHIELMPISEYPFDGSWGYQPVGLFAPTIRHGPPHEFRDLVDAAHRAGIGILLDWVPGHFPTDPHGLGQFDGTALYEHSDPREGFHQDWNTLIYNYGRSEVANYLISNALYWLEEYHADGLRVDAVASMLYRDYSRKEGEWVPNKDGGRANYEAIDLLRNMNTETYGRESGIMTVAEESTSFPKVSHPVDSGGLGFGYKWNMGWMNDTLSYIKEDPINRKHHHHKMTFGLHYAFSENFILPISHDEVVHGKGSMLQRMPGNHFERFANLRAYYGFMWGHPGKKLLFMGQEFAQAAEWNHNTSLDWDCVKNPSHAGIQRLVHDLNALYRKETALHVNDCEESGFQWIEANDAENSVYAWLRKGNEKDSEIAVICNFTPVERTAYRLRLPSVGKWNEILNTDSSLYGGSGRGNMGQVVAKNGDSHGIPAVAEIVLPPLSVIFLKHEGDG